MIELLLLVKVLRGTEQNRLLQERERIKERTSEGIKIAKAEGKYKGRKLGSIQSDEQLINRHNVIYKKLLKGLTILEIIGITSASSATIIKVKKIMTKRNLFIV